jgi:hypothetical protein
MGMHCFASQLTVISFHTVWNNALSKSNSRDAPVLAEGMLERMTQLHNSGALDAKPPTTIVLSYNCGMINCWAKSGRSDAAQKLLRTMQQQYLSGDKSSRPNTITYAIVIVAFVRAGQAKQQ